MDFLSAFYRQRRENAVSLLLQHYQWRQKPVLFCCICTGEGEGADRAGGYVTGQLLQWFRRLDLKRLTKNGERGIPELEDRFDKAIQQIDLELENSGIMETGKRTDIAGIFCLEENYLLFSRGSLRIFLINTAFGAVHTKRLGEWTKEQEMYGEQGILQPDIGLLFATETFCESVTEKRMGEGLFVGEMVTEEQMRRHLAEIGREGERLGSRDVGAILLRTR